MTNEAYSIYQLLNSSSQQRYLQDYIARTVENACTAEANGQIPAFGTDYDGTMRDARGVAARIIAESIQTKGTPEMKDTLARVQAVNPEALRTWDARVFLESQGFTAEQARPVNDYFYARWQSPELLLEGRLFYPHVDAELNFYEHLLKGKAYIVTNKTAHESPDPEFLFGENYRAGSQDVVYNDSEQRVDYSKAGKPLEQSKGDMLVRYEQSNPQVRFVGFSDNTGPHSSAVAEKMDLPVLLVLGDVPPYDGPLDKYLEGLDPVTRGMIYTANPEEIAFAYENIKIPASDYILQQTGLKAGSLPQQLMWGGAEVSGMVWWAFVSPIIAQEVYEIDPVTEPFSFYASSLGTMHVGNAVTGTAMEVGRSLMHTSGRYAAARLGADVIITRSPVVTGAAAFAGRVIDLNGLFIVVPPMEAGALVAEELGADPVLSMTTGLGTGYGTVFLVSQLGPEAMAAYGTVAAPVGLAILTGRASATLYEQKKRQPLDVLDQFSRTEALDELDLAATGYYAGMHLTVLPSTAATHLGVDVEDTVCNWYMKGLEAAISATMDEWERDPQTQPASIAFIKELRKLYETGDHSGLVSVMAREDFETSFFRSFVKELVSNGHHEALKPLLNCGDINPRHFDDEGQFLSLRENDEYLGFALAWKIKHSDPEDLHQYAKSIPSRLDPLGGFPTRCDMDEIFALTEEHGVKVPKGVKDTIIHTAAERRSRYVNNIDAALLGA